MSLFGGRFAAAPNFAYDYAVDRIRTKEMDRVDLGGWEVAVNGAEPVLNQTMTRFVERFSEWGVRPTVFRPAYGLAEATLLVSIGEWPRPATTADAPNHVSCGPPARGVGVAIVDSASPARLPDGEVGEIWVVGEAVCDGYWQNAPATRTTFGGELPGDSRSYLRTGDIGKIQDGELYIIGRVKDEISIRGRSIHAVDVENCVTSCDEFVDHRCAAFAMMRDGVESLCIAVEIPGSPSDSELRQVVQQIRGRIADVMGIGVAAVYLLKRGRIPHTSSGKTRRQECRARLEDGKLALLGQWDSGSDSDSLRPGPEAG